MQNDLQHACATILDAKVQQARPVGGGSISAAYHVVTSSGDVFVKATEARNADWFAAEADGLRALSLCPDIRVPDVLGSATHGARAFLVLDWIEMRAASSGGDARLGRALAALHGITSPRFGWGRNNYIGATAQRNSWCEDWSEFFREHRIGAQLELASRNGYGPQLAALAGKVMSRIEAVIAGDGGPPSLLHGDLWGGNRGVAGDGIPVLFDPAVHYGDGESDMAMSELFGGFGPRFYAAYHEVRPPRGDVAGRRDLYRLYHVLNHLNLFGAGYLSQALDLMRRIAAA